MIQEVVASVFVAGGVFFLVVAAIGFVRLPDVYCRLHVTGVIDTLGAPLVLLGAAIYMGVDLVAAKLILAILFLTVTSPLVGHLLARAAVQSEHDPDQPGVRPARPAKATKAREDRRTGPVDPDGGPEGLA